MESVFAKCPVCGQSKGYVVSGHHHHRKDVQCQHCLAKWKLSLVQGRPVGLMIHELPKNGQGLWRVPSLRGPLFLALGREYPVDFWLKLDLVAGVDWEYMGECVPSKVASVISGKGERTLACWSGYRLISESVTVGRQTVARKFDYDGTLLLTNRRLLWLETHISTRGIVFSASETSWLVKYEIHLDGIKSITGSSGDSRTWDSPTEIHIVDDKGEHNFKLRYAFWELFKPTVESAVVLRQYEVEREKS